MDPQQELKNIQAAIELKKVQSAMAERGKPKPEVPRMGSGPVFSQAGKINVPKKEPENWTEFQEYASELPELIKYKTLGDGLPSGKEAEAIFAIGLGTALTPDPRERAENLKKLGFESRTEDGVTIATAPDGKEFVVNRPGASETDFYEYASNIAMFMPAGRLSAAGWKLGSATWRNIANVLGRAVGGTAATSLAREGAEEMLIPGDQKFSSADVMLDTAFTPLDLIGAKGSAKSLKPAAKNQLDILLERARVSGSTPQESVDSAVEYVKKRPGRPLIESGDPDVMSGVIASGQSPIQAKRTESYIGGRLNEARESFEKVLNVFSDNTTRNVASASEVASTNAAAQSAGILRSKAAAEAIVEDKNLWKSAWADVFYDNVFKSIKKPLKMKLVKDDLLETVANEVGKGSPIYSKIARQLVPLTDSTSGKQVHGVLRAIRDLGRAAKGSDPSSVAGLSGKLSKKLTNKLVDSLDAVSRKALSGAESYYKDAAGEIEALRKTMIGKFAEAGDDSTSTIMKQVMNPSNAAEASLSKNFLLKLNKANPKAAEDLFDGWFGWTLGNISPNEKPSQFLKKLIGTGNPETSPLLSLGEVVKTDDQMRRIREMVDIFQIGGELEQVSSKAARNTIKKEIGQAKSFDLVYLRRLVAENISDFLSPRLYSSWMNAALDPNWAKEWDELISDKKVFNEIRNAGSKARRRAGIEYLSRWERFLEKVGDSADATYATSTATGVPKQSTREVLPEEEEEQ